MSQDALAELKAGIAKLEEGQAEQDKKFTHLLEALEKMPQADLEAINKEAAALAAAKAKPNRLTMLEEATVLEGEETPAPIGNTYDDFMGALHGFQITNTEGARA